MKLSISNIAWNAEEDRDIYRCMRENNYRGLEIAPTRFFTAEPYDRGREELEELRRKLEGEGLEVSALQSILYGKPGLKLFGTEEERESLRGYLKKALSFASVLGAGVLVFGSPQNRIINDALKEYDYAVSFFKDIGESAEALGVCLCMEPNPKEYNTNFINNTEEALKLIRAVASPGFGLHVDTGTLILNREPLKVLEDNAEFIRHFHISEPFLGTISRENRELHMRLAGILKEKNYGNWVSIEMKKPAGDNNVEVVKEVLEYISGIFGG